MSSDIKCPCCSAVIEREHFRFKIPRIFQFTTTCPSCHAPLSQMGQISFAMLTAILFYLQSYGLNMLSDHPTSDTYQLVKMMIVLFILMFISHKIPARWIAYSWDNLSILNGNDPIPEDKAQAARNVLNIMEKRVKAGLIDRTQVPNVNLWLEKQSSRIQIQSMG